VFVAVPVLALLLPALALRWVTGIGRFDAAAGAACGAVVGWAGGIAVGLAPSAGGAVAGALGVAGGVLVQRQRTEQLGPSG
jgi:hypothetical protein